jgi:hypothetical protein
MKTKTTKLVVAVAVATLYAGTMNAQWILGTNTVTALQLNNIGTSSASTPTRTAFNILTSDLTRIVVDGTSYNTTFRGTAGQMAINSNTAGFSYMQAQKSTLGLYASPGCTTNAISGSDIYQAARNIFMQPPVDVTGYTGSSNVGRVFIGEAPFTPTATLFLPKFLVRGGGTVAASCGSISNPDNIGLVSEGNFGESPASPNPNKWISLGSRPTNTTIVDFNSYGYRTQWNNYAGDLAVQNHPTLVNVKDVSLTWQDGLATLSPTNAAYTSAPGLLVQFRNGLAPSGNPIGNLRYTVARYGMSAGSGLVQINGTLIVPNVLNPSDMRLKKDIKTVTNSMDIINRLNPVTYGYKAEEFSAMGLPRTLQYGFIAQELEKVLPTHVADLDNGYKAVNYMMLIPILTKGMQEMNTTVTALKQEVSTLKTENQTLLEQLDRKGVLSASDMGSTNELKNQFFQNKPNPFNDVTTISYAFKQDEAYKIIVTDLTGKKIKEYTNLTGSGDIKVSKDDLPSAGIYLYSLITSGGEIAASKQLIFEK